MSLDVHLYHHLVLDPVVAQKLDAILEKLNSIEGKVNISMKTLDEVLDEVKLERTKVSGLIVLLNGIKQQLTDALAGITLPAAAQAKVDAIFDEASAAAADIDAAVAANVPPTP